MNNYLILIQLDTGEEKIYAVGYSGVFHSLPFMVQVQIEQFFPEFIASMSRRN